MEFFLGHRGTHTDTKTDLTFEVKYRIFRYSVGVCDDCGWFRICHCLLIACIALYSSSRFGFSLDVAMKTHDMFDSSPRKLVVVL